MTLSAAPAYDTEHFAPLPVTGTLVEAFARTVEARANHVAVRSEDGRLSWTWTELAAEVERLAAGLAELGIRHGERVALLMTNRPEFFAIDLALVRIGAVPFSLYATSAPTQHEFSLRDSGAVAVIVEDRFRSALPPDAVPDRRIVLDAPPGDGWQGLDDVRDAGRGLDLASVPPPAPDDLLTIIYTSGTTGTPKGVMLSHRAGMRGADTSLRIARPRAGTVIMSWLPTAHIGERMTAYMMTVVHGMEAVTLADPRRLLEVIPNVQPGYLAATPRIWEKLRADLEGWILRLPESERQDVRDGLAASREMVRAGQVGADLPPEVVERGLHARDVLLAPWRESVGLGRITVAMTSSAANPGELMEFFHAAGVPVNEIYGLSESGTAGTGVPVDEIRFGTVGRAGPGTEVRIAADGEILVRGPSLMSGYLGRPEASAEAIDPEGWLHTGDLGSLDSDGYLTITGRKKELIVGSHGKNIAPVAVEIAIATQTPLIAQLMCVGDARPYLVALVVLDLDYAQAWARDAGLPYETLAELAAAPEVVAEVARAIEAGNALLSRPEQVRKFAVLDREWTPAGGELTPTSKLRRAHIHELYASLIDGLYA